MGRKTLRACIPLFLPEKLLKAVPFDSDPSFPHVAYPVLATAPGAEGHLPEGGDWDLP